MTPSGFLRNLNPEEPAAAEILRQLNELGVITRASRADGQVSWNVTPKGDELGFTQTDRYVGWVLEDLGLDYLVVDFPTEGMRPK
jgi:hypothetical protein